MPTYIQSFEDGAWCVNNEPRQISAGQVVAFEQGWEAEHFIKLGRAGLIGEFGDEQQALAELERLVAANEAARKAAQQQEPANEPEGDEVKDRETKAVTAEGMEVSAPPDQPVAEAPKAKGKKGK